MFHSSPGLSHSVLNRQHIYSVASCSDSVASCSAMLAAARSAFYPARVVDFVDQKIQDARTGTPPMTAFKDIMDLLEEQKISYKKPLEVEEIQVHPANRGGLGLNAFNAHRNGASIKSIGVDPDELAKAVASLIAARSSSMFW